MPAPVYTAVSLGASKATDDSSSQPKRKKIKSVIAFFITFSVTAAWALFHYAGNKKTPPTLLPGGGRDWTLDLTNNVIASKHNPEFALGSLPLDPLILTTRDDDNDMAITFPTDDLKRLARGDRVSLSPLCLQFPEHVDTFFNWDYVLTGINNDEEGARARGEGETNLRAEYVDNNFILFEANWALDVSNWQMKEGNTVNFVKVVDNPKTKWWQKKPKTLEYGGGRDWVLNIEDGTISPKNYPDLILGQGTRYLSIVNTDSDGAWKFDGDELASLKNGGIMKVVNSRGDAAIKKQDEESYFNEWRYIPSRVVSVDAISVGEDMSEDYNTENAVKVKYIDTNYLAIYEDGVPEEKSLVLDVSFWKMTQYNSVNYVGGWKYRGD